MKTAIRLLLVLSILSSMVSCSFINQSNYSKLDDEFTGRKTFTVTQYVNSAEKNFDIGSVKIIFQRIQIENNENLIAYFVINRYSSSFDLENKAFLKANGQKYELFIDKKNTEYKTSTSNSNTSDSTKVNTINTTETSTRNWFEEKFSIPLNKDIATSLIKGNDVFFRFYFGPRVATYKLSESQISNLKKMFEDKL
jgi:hypothetical protein